MFWLWKCLRSRRATRSQNYPFLPINLSILVGIGQHLFTNCFVTAIAFERSIERAKQGYKDYAGEIRALHDDLRASFESLATKARSHSAHSNLESDTAGLGFIISSNSDVFEAPGG